MSGKRRYRVPITVLLDVESPTWQLAISKSNDIISQIHHDVERLVEQQGAKVINIPDVDYADELTDDLLDANGEKKWI